MRTIRKLPPGHTLTVAVQSGSVHVRQVEDGSVGAIVMTSRTFGPYSVERSFTIGDNDSLTITVDPVTEETNALISSGNGAPDDAVRASLTVNPAGDDNALTFTAREYGDSGNSIAIEYIDPSANDAALDVSVFNRVITISLATGSGGAITSTAAEIKAAIDSTVEAARLVTVGVYAADSGTADDGSGVVTAMTKASLSGGAGTGIGKTLKGGLYIDTDNGHVYRNSGTRSVPAWTQLGDAA